MTRDEAERLLQRYDQGVLSATERNRLTEQVAVGILRHLLHGHGWDNQLEFIALPQVTKKEG